MYEAWLKVHRNPSGIICLGSDRGGEFLDNEFTTYLKAVGTTRHLNVHDSPQSNGVVERLNQTLVESAQSMLFSAGLPPFLWAEAIHHTAWIRARIPSRALPGCMTPIERATGQRPNLKHVLVFSTVIWVKVKNASKLDPQAIEGHFVGYNEESKGYRVYFLRCRLVIVERDVFFDKNNVVEGEVAFKGETERPRSISNTTVPNNNATSASDNNNATDNNKAENIPPIVLPDEPQSSKPRRNSLEGLPQYDPDQYG
jgi:hypothetical protein